MTNKFFLSLPIILILSGCAPQLKPSDSISQYFVIPGTSFVPTMLCGIDAGVEACLRMQNGNGVKSVIHTDFKNWIPSLKNSEQAVSESGKTAFVLDKQLGKSLLNSLIKDNKTRESIKKQKYDEKDNK